MKYLFYISLFFYIFIPNGNIYSDVIETKNGMIINGKVIKEKDEIIFFKTFYGTFKIGKENILELHRTKDYKEDIRLFKKKGKKISEEEAKRNFLTGLQALQKENKINKNGNDPKKIISRTEYIASFSPLYFWNLMKDKNSVSSGLGGTFNLDLLLNNPFILFNNPFNKREINITPDIRFEYGYLYSNEYPNKLEGMSFSLGPIWYIYFSVAGASFNWYISPIIGIGNNIKELNELGEFRYSFNFNFTMGLAFSMDQIIITPSFRYFYITDPFNSLMGISIGLGIGLKYF